MPTDTKPTGSRATGSRPNGSRKVRDPAAEQLRIMWRVAGMAFMLSAEVAAGAGIGWLIDRQAGTGQRWMTIGGIAGIVVGLTGFLRSAFKLSRSDALEPPGRRGRKEHQEDTPSLKHEHEHEHEHDRPDPDPAE